MKKWLCLLLCCLLLPAAALAESEFDDEALRRMEDFTVYGEPGSPNTVFRPVNQPYQGQVDEPYEGWLVAYVDFVSLPDYGATLPRVMVSIETFEPVGADAMRLTVSGKKYTFAVTGSRSEYDDVYMEDYAVCLSAVSLPMMKAIAQQKKDQPIQVEFLVQEEVVFVGQVVLPGQEVAELYDTFIDLGGKRQDLKRFDEIWPCEIG